MQGNGKARPGGGAARPGVEKASARFDWFYFLTLRCGCAVCCPQATGHTGDGRAGALGQAPGSLVLDGSRCMDLDQARGGDGCLGREPALRDGETAPDADVHGAMAASGSGHVTVHDIAFVRLWSFG